MANFDLDVPINGMPPQEYIAKLLEKNEKQEIEIEVVKAQIGLLKQYNNHSRLLLETAKYKLKEQQLKNTTTNQP